MTRFVSQKYKLMHMTRFFQHYNMTCTLTVERSLIKVKTDIKILDMQVNSKLKQGSHINKIKMKIAQQLKAFTMLKTSTQKALFTKAYYFYTAIIQLIIIYVAPVWYESKKVLKYYKKLLKKMQQLQNKYVKVVTEAYRTINTKVLEKKTRIMSIDIYIKKQIINVHKKDKPRINNVVIDTCKHICDCLKEKQGKNRFAKITL